MKTIWSVVRLQARVTLLSPKAWIALLLGLLIGATEGWDILVVARQLGYPLQMIEPFLILTTSRTMQVFAVVGVALLLSDAPFANMNTPYLVFRTHRRVWMIGNAVYMLIACWAYMLIIVIASILVTMPFSYIQDQWSTSIQLLASGQTALHLRSGRYVDLAIIQSMGPYYACVWQYALFMLYSFCVSGLMLLTNTVQKRSAGFAIAMLFHGLMLVMYMDGHPIGAKLSLFAHSRLDVHIKGAFPLSESILIFVAFASLVYGLSILRAKRMDI